MFRLNFLSALALSALTTPLLAQDFALSSQVQGYAATLGSDLPAAPDGRVQDCHAITPQTRAGKDIAARGWQVISESALGGKTIVTFAANSESGPQGSCLYDAGNLGIFTDETMHGLIWSAPYPIGPYAAFGSLELTDGGQLRLYDSDYPSKPVGDLTFTAPASFALVGLPATEARCNGKVELPLGWGKTIGSQREALLAQGWQAKPMPAADEITEDLQKAGFIEADSCSGTGLNYCSFIYTQKEAELRVITIGELVDEYQPTVSDYDLNCEGAAQ